MVVLERRGRVLLLALIALFFSITFLLLLSRDLRREIDHDEHQFIASGELLSQDSLIPYRDYPYFHLPNLILVYALVFKTTNYPFLAARIFSALCAMLGLGVVFYVAFRLFREWPYPRRFLLGAGSVILLLANPLFTYTSGLTWNHDLPVLLTLLAFVIHCRARMRVRPGRWVLLSGMLLGLAVGTRVFFAPVVLPFLAAVLFFPAAGPARAKLRLVLLTSLGIVVSLAPVIGLFALAPKQFVFGNVGYAKLAVLYKHKIGYPDPMTPVWKAEYFKGILEQPANLLLFLLFTVLVFSRRLFKPGPNARESFAMIFAMSVIFFLLIGSFAPPPSNYQYFYPPVPFVTLGILYAMATLYPAGDQKNLVLRLFACVVLLSAASGWSEYSDLGSLLSPSQWTAVKVHRIGSEIKGVVGDGKVLTLSPIFPLEGGLDIYKEFAPGPFAWRVAPLVPENERRRFGLVSPNELRAFLTAEPPRGILVGSEAMSNAPTEPGQQLDQPFIDYAKENRYKAVELSDGQVLWVRQTLSVESTVRPR